MMVYVYKCKDHGIFEVKQHILDKHIAYCPSCGKRGDRLLFPVGHYYDNPKPLYHKDGSYEEKF